MIRRAKASDAAQVREIYCHPLVNPFMNYDPMPLKAFRKAWKKLRTKCEMWVVEEKGEILAYGGYEHREGKASHTVHLWAFAVQPGAHGKGIGSQLMRFFLARARKQGVLRVQLTAEADNKKALRFYRKHGFRKEGRLRKGSKRKTGCVDLIALAKLF